MRIVTWTIRVILFLVLAALAAKNVEPVTLRFYFDHAVQAPLAVALFAAFALGVVLGMLALLGVLLRQRREIASLKKQNTPESPPPAPPI
jgi:putative membrane protein